jgi:RNA polymerase sigma-70 factor, ECF subfamily
VLTCHETIPHRLCLMFMNLLLVSLTAVEGDDDESTVRECIRGDRGAFDRLVAKYYRKIYNLSYRFVGDQEEANDLAQEIFTAAYQNIKRFRGDSKFSTWLFQIAANRGKNRFKYLKRRGFFVNKGSWDTEENGGSTPREIPDYEGNPENLLARKQIQQIVQNVIDQLDPDHKEIVILRDIEGLSYEEIGKILHLPEGTTKSRLHRARMEVKEKLKRVLS